MSRFDAETFPERVLSKEQELKQKTVHCLLPMEKDMELVTAKIHPAETSRAKKEKTQIRERYIDAVWLRKDITT